MTAIITPESLMSMARYEPNDPSRVILPGEVRDALRAAAYEIERLQAVISDAHAVLWTNRHSREALMTNPPMNALAYGVAERILKPALTEKPE